MPYSTGDRVVKNLLPDLVRLLLNTPITACDIAHSLGISRTTVTRYRLLLRERGTAWDEVSELTGAQLHALFNKTRRASGKELPDFSVFDRRLGEPGMTMYRLWSEYVEATPPGAALGYSQCAKLYARDRGPAAVALTQKPNPGERVYVDFSGKVPHYFDRTSGEKVPVQMFVAVLGASNYTYVQCTATQSVPDWIEVNSKMLAFFGGAPQAVVPDNLKAAVTKPGPVPVVQTHYLEWARHFGMAVLPARPGKPRDKGRVESAVRFVQEQILPELNKHRYFSLDEINEAIAPLLTVFNNRPFQAREGSRRSQFETIEAPALRALPATPYVYREWVSTQLVPNNYHVAVLGNFYSVPHSLVGKRVQACVTQTHIEIHCDGARIARHARHLGRAAHTTIEAHQPEAHRAMGERSPEHVNNWAQSVGPNMSELIKLQFKQKVPLQGLPSALSIKSLEKAADASRLEAAAGEALRLRVANPTGLRRILGAVPAVVVNPSKPTRLMSPLRTPPPRRPRQPYGSQPTC